jgi:hypothetical protein
MKVTPWEDVLSGSARVRLSNSAREASEESLFSLLVKVENRLRAGIKEDRHYGPGRRKAKSKVSWRSISGNLSRYIE